MDQATAGVELGNQCKVTTIVVWDVAGKTDAEVGHKNVIVATLPLRLFEGIDQILRRYDVLIKVVTLYIDLAFESILIQICTGNIDNLAEGHAVVDHIGTG